MREDCQLRLRKPGACEVPMRAGGVGSTGSTALRGPFPTPETPSSKHARSSQFLDCVAVASGGNRLGGGKRVSGLRVHASSENPSGAATRQPRPPVTGRGKPHSASRFQGGERGALAWVPDGSHWNRLVSEGRRGPSPAPKQSPGCAPSSAENFKRKWMRAGWWAIQGNGQAGSGSTAWSLYTTSLCLCYPISKMG